MSWVTLRLTENQAQCFCDGSRPLTELRPMLVRSLRDYRLWSAEQQKRFPKGSAVVLSEKGKQNFAGRVHRFGGVVVGYGRSGPLIRVRLFGSKSPQANAYHVCFWELAPGPTTEENL